MKPDSKSKYSPKLQEWYIPLWKDKITLGAAYDQLISFGNDQNEVPLMVQIVENPKFNLKGLGFFKGRVTLQRHDFIHIILGRGTKMIDEAFTIGFTMGSTNRVSTTQTSIFSWVSGTLYPKAYRFSKRNMQVFRDAVSLAYVSDCKPLDKVNFKSMRDLTIREARKKIGLETDLLQAYYHIEAKRYPNSSASQRLIKK
ncbi:MAG: hypothetical protein AAGA18_10925 [Verrucomicrobiota bacterium]